MKDKGTAVRKEFGEKDTMKSAFWIELKNRSTIRAAVS
jgi:hypothetical protein